MNNKIILDACCGPKLFWFDKNHPNTIYNDKRIREKGFNDYRTNREIKPDTNFDLRKPTKFKDNQFKLVVFDPPHLFGKGETHRMVKDYGYWNKETWKTDLKAMFDECWRVLDSYGILIFKWNEASIKKKEVLEVLKKEPLFGHPVRSKIKRHWFCFMKLQEIRKEDK